ncbi:nucleoside triphosphate hydrolase protein [Wolfiporia cocos MD-104 SS10]|uniref:DNA 3'-5' helicase n=1 Tax=Wolfiporia cocos (strain MD-104) TaxID=742152 RepID=A0A2H3JM33_WOLCO|nr:nucleoside triphosphate hydrolase protein [Wolfiporia cocos MD-104 SS10]
MHSYASAGPSTNCTPNFDRRPNAPQSGNREPRYTIGGPCSSTSSESRRSFFQATPSRVATSQHAPPRVPNLLTASNRLAPTAQHVGYEAQNSAKGSNPHNVHGVRLRPVSQLPDMYRGMFKFGVFNAVQSACYDTVMHTDENMIIDLTRSRCKAPTGSGKTVLFELAIIRMLTHAGGNSKPKCIYVAPTKALCSEKCRDWTAKFQPLGINCCELTGDTVQFGKSAWGPARDASVMCGEKWDSLTRNWRDHRHILSQVQLFMVDEVHILNESRGSTLEVILSRMKTRGSSVRFIVVSATVPNIDDVASWLGNGTPDGSATVMQFGEDYRPCKLSKFVYGIPKKRDHNDFQYQKTLDYRLYRILLQHSVNKPMLVFCSTRKGVLSSAKQVMKEYEEASGKQQALPWTRPARIDQTFRDQELEKLAACGIGVHHAGMNMDDRRTIEDLYIKKVLRIIFATSTLAVGVNLPAHTVIIKGVKIFQNNTTQEYSDLDIMQMMGRAGRPQFDKEGVAVILCETELEAKYNALVQGRTVLESCLHLNLSEHINSEVGLGTITDLDSAKAWLQNSFMFRRIQKNPNYYAIGKDNNQTWQDRINEMVTQSVRKLQETELVSFSDDIVGTLSSTEYGDIMSKACNCFYIRQSTMSLILKLPERASVREILELLSSADEFSDIKIRGGEKQAFNKLRSHNDIRFQLKRVEKSADKVLLLLQAILGSVNLHGPELKSGDNNPYAEANLIFRHVSRIAKAVVEVAIVKKAGALLKSSLEVLRCVTAKAWEDRHVVLRQVEHIGEKSQQVLAENGISTIEALRKQSPLRIEALLNRRPPFGHEVLAALQQFPQYVLRITEEHVSTHKGVEVDLSIECGLAVETESRSKPNTVKNRFADMTTVLALTSDLDFVDFRRVPTKLLIEPKSFTLTIKLEKPSQSVVVYISSELMLEGVVEDPRYWDMTNDDDDTPPIKSDTAVTPHRQYMKAPQRHTDTFMIPSGAKLGPKRLSNGKFEYNIALCNHTCKEKTKCKHSCCRDGLDKPPAMSKKRVEAICAEAEPDRTGNIVRHSEVARPKPTTRPKPKTKPCDKPDARLEQLEALHGQTNVMESLKLPSGQRLKLDSDLKSKLSTKPMSHSAKSGSSHKKLDDDAISIDSDDGAISIDSDDDMPDPQDLLDSFGAAKRGRSPSNCSETYYANSSFDALIQNLSEHDLQNLTQTSNFRPATPINCASSPIIPAWSSPSYTAQKRRSPPPGPSPPSKRARMLQVGNSPFKMPSPSYLQTKVGRIVESAANTP